MFFGGARGGGKTDAVLGKWAIKAGDYGPAFNAMMFRRTKTSAEDAIERSKDIYGPLGGRFNEGKYRWVMPHGGRVGFGYLDSVQDAQEWQGRNLTDVWIEEAGQYPSPLPIDRMQAVLRSARGVPTQMILTGNPGGPGQHWIRDRYKLYPFPAKPFTLKRMLPNGDAFDVAVIPSRLRDNKILLRDPHYVARLYQVGSAQLVKAWLDGDWSAVEGAFFDTWSRERNVIAPCGLPPGWLRFRSLDWGSAKPFSAGWWCVAGEPFRAGGVYLARGALVRYREWYGAKSPNVGLKLTAESVAEGVKKRTGPGEVIDYTVADPSMFKEDGGPSLAERFGNCDVYLVAGDNTRIARDGAVGGWDQMRARIEGDAEGPMLAVFDTCTDFIRTVPVLQHDQTRAEDLDTESEDHAADEGRYACMSRPWVAATRPKELVARDKYRKRYDEEQQGSWKTV